MHWINWKIRHSHKISKSFGIKLYALKLTIFYKIFSFVFSAYLDVNVRYLKIKASWEETISLACPFGGTLYMSHVWHSNHKIIKGKLVIITVWKLFFWYRPIFVIFDHIYPYLISQVFNKSILYFFLYLSTFPGYLLLQT